MFVDAIVGGKGSGKTPLMLEEMDRMASDKNNNIVFIEYGQGVEHLVPYSVRRIDLREYPVRGYGQLIAFLAGMNAKDYDISHIYIDSIFKVVRDDNLDHLASFIKDLEALGKQVDCKMTVAVSCDLDELPDDVRHFARA